MIYIASAVCAVVFVVAFLIVVLHSAGKGYEISNVGDE